MSSTFDLFALPSYHEGIGSVIDLAGSFHNYNGSPTPEDADMKALFGDWQTVCNDFSSAFQQIQRQVILE